MKGMVTSMNKKKDILEPKKTVGVILSESIYDTLQEMSADYGASVSTVIRMIVVDYIKRYKNYSLINVEERKDEN